LLIAVMQQKSEGALIITVVVSTGQWTWGVLYWQWCYIIWSMQLLAVVLEASLDWIIVTCDSYR